MKPFFVAILMFTDASLGKDLLVVKEDANELQHDRPKVQQYRCKLCFVADDDNSACLTYGGNMQVGWNWVQ
jgi:hypothetical protein